VQTAFQRVNVVSHFLPAQLAEKIIKNSGIYINDKSALQKDIKNSILKYYPDFEEHLENMDINNLAEKIIQTINISDDKILTTILMKNLRAEFNMQINNIYRPKERTEIALKIKDTVVKIQVANNKIVEVSNSLNLNTEVIYIDDPYVMDDYGDAYMLYSPPFSPDFAHREHLRRSIVNKKPSKGVIDEINASKKLEKVFETLNSVCPGEMVRGNDRSFAYMEGGPETKIDVVNLSTGLKTFAIIKTLLLNGCLEDNGTIILDEPEIHLHPEWQLIFAELIVLLQKEFNMHILLNTHSPYLLKAIEVYSQKHSVADKCKYYLANSSGPSSVITDVSDNIELIYEKFASPLQDLQNEGNS